VSVSVNEFMSKNTGTCEYFFDCNDPQTWNDEREQQCYLESEVLNDDGVWKCSRETKNGHDFCIFHSDIEEKDNSEVMNSLQNEINQAPQETGSDKIEKLFIGSKFKDFDLNDVDLDVEQEVMVRLSHSEIHGKFEMKDTETNFSWNFNGVQFHGVANFENTAFKKSVSFIGAEFQDDSIFNMTKFQHVIFSESTFFGASKFWHAIFEADATFSSLSRPKRYSGPEFHGDAEFLFAKFEGLANFTNAQFNGCTTFRDVEFGGETRFTGAKFSGSTNFSDAEFDKVTFNDVDIGGSDFSKADLTDSSFVDAKCREANFESSLLNRASLFGADFRGAKLSGALLGDAQIDEDTDFLGNPSDDRDLSEHTLSSIISQPCCIYDPGYLETNADSNIDKAKSVYRSLEELADKSARTRLQSRCFIRRQDLQKEGYKQDLKESKSLEEKIIAGARYSRAKVARITLLYGESPWRVIGGSIGFIFFIGLLYPLGEWLQPIGDDPITYTRIFDGELSLIIEALYFSTLTFTTLGMGDYNPMGFGQILATINTSFGAVLIALLVFVLGRRAAR